MAETAIDKRIPTIVVSHVKSNVAVHRRNKSTPNTYLR